MKNSPIYFIFCYARSGGTFFNRYLNNYDELLVLSEAHPINTQMKRMKLTSIKEQAREWYGIEVGSDNYVDQIAEIKDWCDKNNKYLVIRDWSYIDFAKSYLNDFNPPEYSINIKLLGNRFHVKKVAFVRDSIDVFLSQDRKIEEFSKEYFNYVKYIKSENIKFFKYEDFVENDEKCFRKMCKELGLSLNVADKKQTVSSKNVMGDINVSRGNSSSKIMKLKRRYAGFFKRKKINKNECLFQANSIFKYEGDYDSKECENLLTHIKFKVKVFPQKLKNCLYGKYKRLKYN